jgi:hypothetical protein
MSNKNKIHLLVIIVLVCLVYSSAVPNELGLYDNTLLLGSPALSGFGFENLKALFTSLPNGIEYQPVRELTYMIDYEIWGCTF